MNKAFVREPDQVDARCPRCQSPGHAVGPQTLAVWVPAAIRRSLAESAYFCPDSQCDVVYYDDFEAIVTRAELPGLIPIKDVDAPLCACFGLTCDDIDQDIAEGTVARTRAAVVRAQSPDAHCVSAAPNGRSCVAAVQGYYLKRRNQAAGD